MSSSRTNRWQEAAMVLEEAQAEAEADASESLAKEEAKTLLLKSKDLTTASNLNLPATSLYEEVESLKAEEM
jgi:hypothetical protein